jgi:ABC-2 type transport system permease protein
METEHPGERYSSPADCPPSPSARLVPSSPSPLGEFPSVEAEARAFGRLRRRIIATLLRQALSQSRFRVSLVVVLTTLLWAGMFWMFHEGFEFLRLNVTNPETHGMALGVVFGHFFFWLMLMLVFSSGIILYSSLFRSREMGLLLTIPARTQRVFLHKFQEAVILSSWGFALLGSPMLLAYGIVADAPWYYYALLPPFLAAFIYIPVAIGAIVCLWIVRRVPEHLLAVSIGGGALLLAGAVWMVWSVLTGPKSNLLTPGWFQETLGRLRISDQRLLPSWWLSTGLLAAAGGVWYESVRFLALMVSNALLFRQLALWTAGRIYRAAYSGLYGKTFSHKRFRAVRFDRLLSRLIGFLPAAMRLMIVKDLRLFRRDPLQWSQFLIFLVLLGLYFLNIPSFSYDVSSIAWVNMVSFLNLSVVGLLLSTFTTRFIYPMISVEGRRFWILGPLGMRRETIIWSKFAFAVLGSIIPCSGLVLMSDLMLKVSLLVVASHQLTCLVLCLGLAGIAVGLGAWLPNPREESPSRIAAGFGGTLTLVISTLYILVVVLLTALPTHFYLVAEYAHVARQLGAHANVGWWLTTWLVSGIAGSLVLGAVATAVPLWIGFRAFRQMEFC